MSEKKEIPEVGHYYHFWDDGKTSSSRHYICRVEGLLTNDEAKHLSVTVPEWDFEERKEVQHTMTLYEQWEYEKNKCNWLYADETDYFVRISCPVYDENDLYAVRTKNGGWFTFDIQTSWQSGRLDVDGDIYKELVEEYGEECYPPADEKHYHKI